jgi:hypothetical protein
MGKGISFLWVKIIILTKYRLPIYSGFTFLQGGEAQVPWAGIRIK